MSIAIVVTLSILVSLSCSAQQVVVVESGRTLDASTVNNKADEARQQFWSERVGVRIIEKNDYALYAVLSGLSHIATNQPELSSSDLEIVANASMDGLRGVNPNASAEQAAQEAFTSLISSTSPYVGMAMPVVMDITTTAVREQIENLYALHPGRLRENFIVEGPAGLKEIWRAASNDPRLKAEVNRILLARYGVSMDDLPGVVLDPVLDKAKAAVTTLQQPLTNRDAILKSVKDDQKAVRDKIDSLVKRLNSREIQKARERELKSEYAAFKAGVADGKAGVFLVSTAVGFVDPSLGRKVAVLGNAYLKIAQANGEYRFSQMPALAGSVKYSSLRLSADVVSACLTVASLMSDTGPTADELIMQQLAAISKQIISLRSEMHDRFDRVDRNLNRIYVDLIANFQQLDRNLARARQGIIGLQIEVFRMHDQFGELDRKAQSYAQAVSRQLSLNSLSHCLEAQDYVAGFVLSREEQAKCAVIFARRATRHSKDEVWVNKSSQFPLDRDLAQELGGRPLEQNLNLIWGIASARYGFRPSPSLTLANPLEWAVNANAYMRVVGSGSSALLSERATDEVIAVGEEIQQFLMLLNRRERITPKGPESALFERVLDNLAQKARGLNSNVAAFELAYQTTNAAGYDPWGTNDQQKKSSTKHSWTATSAPDASPVEILPTLSNCEGTTDYGQVQVPLHILEHVPYTLRMAHEFGIGQVVACYKNVRWVDRSRYADEWSGRINLEVVLTFKSTAPPQGKGDEEASVSVQRSASDRKKRRADAESTTLPATPQAALPQKMEFVIAHFQNKGQIYHRLNCAVQPGDGLAKLVAISDCNKPRADNNGLTAEDLKEQFARRWSEAGGLSQTFLDSPTIVSDALSTTEDTKKAGAVVEERLSIHRVQLRREVLDAMTSPEASTSEEMVGMVLAFREYSGIKALLDSIAALTLSDSILEDDAISSSITQLAPSTWGTTLANMQGRRGRIAGAVVGKQSRTLAVLSISSQIAALRQSYTRRPVDASESNTLVEVTLRNLRTFRRVQQLSKLGSEHICFDRVTFTPLIAAEQAQIKGEISKLRLRLVSESDASPLEVNKANLVLGTKSKMYSLLIPNAVGGSTAAAREVSVQLAAEELSEAGVAICLEWSENHARSRQAGAYVEALVSGEEWVPVFKLEKLTIPPGKKTGIAVRMPVIISGAADMSGQTTQR